MEEYKARVVGFVWWPNGMECSQEYRFLAENDQDALEKIDQITGAFSQVKDFELFRRENCPHCGHVVWECVKEFTTEGASIYLECMA